MKVPDADVVQQALAIQLEAAAEGFDWQDSAGLWLKLNEEIEELKAAETPAHRLEELGDLLFMVLNLARHLNVDPAAALHATNQKFAQRWGHVAAHRSTWPQEPVARLAAMEALWQDAKQRERNVSGQLV